MGLAMLIIGMGLEYTIIGWWFQPLWKIWKSIGMMTFQTEWENKSHVPVTTSQIINIIIIIIILSLSYYHLSLSIISFYYTLPYHQRRIHPVPSVCSKRWRRSCCAKESLVWRWSWRRETARETLEKMRKSMENPQKIRKSIENPEMNYVF